MMIHNLDAYFLPEWLAAYTPAFSMIHKLIQLIQFIFLILHRKYMNHKRDEHFLCHDAFA